MLSDKGNTAFPQKNNPPKIKGIYGIIDPEACPGRDPSDLARDMLEGSISVVQLRAKKYSSRALLQVAKKIAGIAEEYSALFIVNDRLDVALAAGAQGVHLGQDDLPITYARQIAGPEFIIGQSTHSIEEAQKAGSDGADYIGFGAMYKTSTKSDVTKPQGPGNLARVVKAVSIPVIAIGGISLDHLPEIAKTGAAGAAVISALCSAEDVRATAKQMTEVWNLAKQSE